MDKKETNKIHCHVDNCIFHSGDCCCEAGCIEVGSDCGCTCNCESETQCKTFKAK